MSSDATVITVDNISKCYQIYDQPKDRLKQFLYRGRRKFFREFWALHPLTFSIGKGECVGFVGRNGSGKSTLLQIIAGIVTPTTGSYSAVGRIAALLELGAGFNAEFSGRENVFLNASILGLSRSEVQERMASIESFAEIGDFIDQPVRTYSSGMYVRLAFAVAIHVDPDILIVDEALAVGDAAFQYKCLRKIEELRNQGMGILFVTHDTGAVKRFCNRAGWIHNGSLVALGDGVEVANQYEDFLRSSMVTAPEVVSSGSQADGIAADATGGIRSRILTADLLDGHGATTAAFVTGAELKLRVRYEVFSESSRDLVVGVAIFRSDDLYVCGLNTGLDGVLPEASVGIHEIELICPELRLLAGSYYLKMGVFDKTGQVRWDFRESSCPFSVSSPYVAEGVVVLEHFWNQNSVSRKNVGNL